MSIGMCFDDLYISRFDTSFMTLSETVQAYQKLDLEIRQLTGFDLDTLKRLFAAGYTLKPPAEHKTLMEELDEQSSI